MCCVVLKHFKEQDGFIYIYFPLSSHSQTYVSTGPRSFIKPTFVEFLGFKMKVKNLYFYFVQDSLQTENEAPMTTIPFLLQLANMSPMLLQVLATDLVTSCRYKFKVTSQPKLLGNRDSNLT